MSDANYNNNYAILRQLISLPRKMVHAHGTHEMADLVLHELCHPGCFNLDKAAYFVDNPDFNCFKGVSGFNKDDLSGDYAITWENPDQFLSHAHNAPFNKHVRGIERDSFRNNKIDDKELAYKIAQDLGFKNHDFSAWNMRHGNHGIFVYEKKDEMCVLKDHLQDGLYFLSFCPII